MKLVLEPSKYRECYFCGCLIRHKETDVHLAHLFHVHSQEYMEDFVTLGSIARHLDVHTLYFSEIINMPVPPDAYFTLEQAVDMGKVIHQCSLTEWTITDDLWERFQNDPCHKLCVSAEAECDRRFHG